MKSTPDFSLLCLRTDIPVIDDLCPKAAGHLAI